MSDFIQRIDDELSRLGKDPFNDGEIEQLTPTSFEMLEQQING